MDFVTANRCAFLDLMSLIDVGTQNLRICEIIQFKRNPSTHSLTCFRFICQVKNTASIYYIITLVVPRPTLYFCLVNKNIYYTITIKVIFGIYRSIKVAYPISKHFRKFFPLVLLPLTGWLTVMLKTLSKSWISSVQ